MLHAEQHVRKLKNQMSKSKIEYNGKIKTIREWSVEFGMSEKTLARRLRDGMSIEDAIKKPVRAYDGQSNTLIRITCENCGEEFLRKSNKQILCEKCANCSQEQFVERHQKYKLRKQNVPTDPTRKTWGCNYAEMQKQETLRMIGEIK